MLECLRGRPNVVVSSQSLAVSTSLSADQVDAELSSVLVDHVAGTLGAVGKDLGPDVLRLHAKGWSCGPAGVYEYLIVPSAFEIEQWVDAEDHARLDAALAATGTRAPHRTDRAPRLRWMDGTSLSMGAQAWVLTQLLSERFVRQVGERDAAKPVRGAAELVALALEPPSTVGLAQWVLDAKLSSSSTARVPRNDAVIDWLASQVDAGEVSRSRALGLMGTEHVQARRWAFLWGELRSPRFPDAVSDERPCGAAGVLAARRPARLRTRAVVRERGHRALRSGGHPPDVGCRRAPALGHPAPVRRLHRADGGLRPRAPAHAVARGELRRVAATQRRPEGLALGRRLRAPVTPRRR